jgi:hypothetical protein
MNTRPLLPDGLVAVVKRDCATCVMVAPVLAALQSSVGLTVYTQDDLTFPEGVSPVDDTALAVSYFNEIETVPTLMRVVGGAEVERIVGWNRSEWRAFTGDDLLGAELPTFRPGCGSLSVDPDRAIDLAVRYGGSSLRARRIELASAEDEMEAMFERGWSDGLPLVPPTEARVMRMLEGTTLSPSEIVAVVPPDLVEVSVEKIAINAVMAGCKPEYLPVVIAAVRAACTDTFNMHGVLATTMPVGPVMIVNGPIRRAIGMNSGVNVLGQGNRANSTIGRALQLVIRNVGGGRPDGVDRATHGNPGKLGWCFPEDEESSPFSPFSASQGFQAGENTLTLFAGEGPRGMVDQLSRTPESLAKSFAVNLRTVQHPKLVMAFDAILIIGPDHARVFAEAGWSRDRLIEEISSHLLIDGAELVRGANDIAEGIPAHLASATLPKFRPGGLMIIHAGGGAGLFSTIIAGWANGAMGSEPVTVPI